MRKVSSSAFIALVCSSSLVSATLPPVERLEGGSVSEDDTGYYDPNYYLSDDNPYAPASDGDADLGQQVVLQPQLKRAPVRVRADASLFWSNNVASVDNGTDDGWYFGGSLSARWKQRLNSYLHFDTYAYQDAYIYDSDDLDFQSSEFGIGLIADVPFLEGLSVYGRYEFLYIHAENPLFGALGANEHTDSRYHRLRLGAYKALYTKPSHLVSLAANGRWDFDASAGAQRRQHISTRLSYTWAPTGRLRATAFYRVAYRDYIASGREDWNQYMGVELNHKINDWAEAYGSIVYGMNDSNAAGRDYEALQAGLGLGFRASF